MTEDQLHRQVADYLREEVAPNVSWCHVPNGGLRSKAQAARLKAMGVCPGWPDLQFLWTDQFDGFRFLLLELKTETGTLTPSQKALFPHLEAIHGQPVAICRSLSDVIEALRVHRVPTLGRVRLR